MLDQIKTVTLTEEAKTQLAALEAEGVIACVFIGWTGQRPGVPCFMPFVHSAYYCVDKQGRAINSLDANGNYVDPTSQPNYGGKKVHEMLPGALAFVPTEVADKEAYANAVKSEQFAQLQYLEQIQEWYSQGKTGREIHDAICLDGGLIALPPESENCNGGCCGSFRPKPAAEPVKMVGRRPKTVKEIK